MEPITEHRTINGPYVYGYLRHLTGSAARHAALVDSLAEYCRQHELTLRGLFTEREATAEAGSLAFAELLDALMLPDAYGVVVPAYCHLGPRHVAVERARQIDALSSRLIVVRSAAPRCSHEHSAEMGPMVQQEGSA